MRFLANENFPRLAVEALQAQGHDVLWMRTAAPGERDPSVLARAQAEQRIPVWSKYSSRLQMPEVHEAS
jgi:hypothetical protein